MLDALCSEYSWSPERALRMPLALAFCFLAAARKRMGDEFGAPDYKEREMLEKLNRDR